MQAQQQKKNSLQLLCEMATEKTGFGRKSCAADKQACAFGGFEFNNNCMITGISLQTV